MKIIKYNLIEEVNVGTKETPIIERRKGALVEMPCTDDVLESNLAIAQMEAFDDPIVDDDGQPDVVDPGDDIDNMLIDHELRLTMIELYM